MLESAAVENLWQKSNLPPYPVRVSAAFDSNSRFDFADRFNELSQLKCPPLSIQTAGSTITNVDRTRATFAVSAAFDSNSRFDPRGCVHPSWKEFSCPPLSIQTAGSTPWFRRMVPNRLVSAAFDSNSRFDRLRLCEKGRSLGCVRRFRFKQPVRQW